MEQKAKRVGKFNIIDIIAVILIVAVVAFGAWKLLGSSGGTAAEDGGMVKVTYVVKCEGVPTELYETCQAHLPSPLMASGALVGGLLGFLCYNHYPAKVFMGDTGSLFLGGAVAALAFAYDMPLILLLVGFVYLCETLSDIIQVTYFKLTHGKRVFRMAPLHHHFELGGWSETRIVAVFSIITAILCLVALIAM